MVNALADKRGFGLQSGFWNRFGVSLIEAPIDKVSTALAEHFGAQCERDIFSSKYVDLADPRRCLWQYKGHSWTVWWAFGYEYIIFTLAYLLNTKSIILTHQGTSGWTNLKVFSADRWIEEYDCGCSLNGNEQNDESDDTPCSELEFTYVYSQDNNIWSTGHIFTSAVRQISKAEMLNSLQAGEQEYGFLDHLLRYHGAYLPELDETPLDYLRYCYNYDSFYPVRDDFERVDAVILRQEAFYWRNILSPPDRVG